MYNARPVRAKNLKLNWRQHAGGTARHEWLKILPMTNLLKMLLGSVMISSLVSSSSPSSPNTRIRGAARPKLPPPSPDPSDEQKLQQQKLDCISFFSLCIIWGGGWQFMTMQWWEGLRKQKLCSRSLSTNMISETWPDLVGRRRSKRAMLMKSKPGNVSVFGKPESS